MSSRVPEKLAQDALSRKEREERRLESIAQARRDFRHMTPEYHKKLAEKVPPSPPPLLLLTPTLARKKW